MHCYSFHLALDHRATLSRGLFWQYPARWGSIPAAFTKDQSAPILAQL